MQRKGNGLSWPTVALIIATGGANLLGTHQGNLALSSEQQEAIHKIRELHSEIDDFKRWQTEATNNQREIMKTDSRILEEIRGIVTRLDRMKSVDQNRGLPP